jgi:NTE family protein
MRVGLVLGAGGVLGGSWLMGALEALEAETGWRASEAEVVVGTSAGAVIGALAAAGIRSEYMSAYAAGHTLDEAVSASCAIPGFYHPVRVGGRRYVDGGICSVSNLDLLCDEALDLVICLNPMSSLTQATGGSPADRMAAVMRASAGRRLGHEARKLREAGTRVLVLQPGERDASLMGFNLMSGARRLEVMEQARRSVGQELRGIRRRRDLVPARRPRRSGARAASRPPRRRAA